MATLISHMIEMNVNRLGLVRERPGPFPMDNFDTGPARGFEGMV